MEIKTRLTIFTAVSFLVTSTFAYAMPVTDLGSYVYYAEQLAEASKTVTEMKKMVSTATETMDSINDMKKTAEKSYNSVVGSYKKGQRFVKQFQDFENMFNEKPRTLEGQYAKWRKIGKKGTRLSNKTLDMFGDPEAGIETNFRDPRSPMYDYMAEMDKKFQFRQSSLKNSIAKSQSILAGTGERMDKVKDLAGEIDTTENVKDAQDLTNALLTEILVVINELVKLTAHMAESEGLMEFAGVEDEVMKDKAEEIENIDDRKEEINKAVSDGQKRIQNKYKTKIIQRGIL